jgi:hypothetical protein
MLIPMTHPAGMSKIWTIALAVGLVLSACGGQIVSETFEHVGTELPEPTTAAASGSAATFDLELVKSTLVDECARPTIVDDAFCEEVDIDGMTADGRALFVPTTLAEDAARAIQICYWISDVRVAYLGRVPLAEFFNTVLDRDGRARATCAVP